MGPRHLLGRSRSLTKPSMRVVEAVLEIHTFVRVGPANGTLFTKSCVQSLAVCETASGSVICFAGDVDDAFAWSDRIQ